MGVYENTLEDIKNTWGTVPGFMRIMPRESLVHDWPLWKRENLGEVDVERLSYLLSADDMLEEMLSGAPEESIAAETGRMARTVCCGALVDADRAPVARARTGERFLVCSDSCRTRIEAATPKQIEEISSAKLQG